MTPIPPTRGSLLVRLRDVADHCAWREFVDLYAPLVYGYARKQGLQDADAADLSQEVLTSVASALGQFDYDPRRGAFRNWLFTIVRHKLSDFKRRSNRQEQGSGDTGQQELIAQNLANQADSDAEWDVAWQKRIFAWACQRVHAEVTPSTWRAFWQTAIDGKPAKEVAPELGLSIAAVYLARSRVLARIKECIRTAEE